MKEYLLFILIIIIILLFNTTIVEGFNNKKNNKIQSNITLEEFNKNFNINIKEVPNCTALIGFDVYSTKKFHIYCDKPHKYLSCTLKYWIKNIHSKLNREKYYFILNYSDGFVHDEVKDYKTYISSNTNNPIPHIFAFCRRWNDEKTFLLPDPYFTCDKLHRKNFKKIDEANLKWSDKINLCIWRGSIKNGLLLNFFNSDNKYNLNQRKYFVKLYNNKYFKNVDYENKFTTVSHQIKYKYILDIDGWASTWDATLWKLYSGSVLLKVDSTWNQWYYPDLIVWKHYVPVNNDFSNLNEIIDWCNNNESACLQIIENAKNFVKKTFDLDYVNNAVIKKMNNYLLITNQ